MTGAGRVQKSIRPPRLEPGARIGIVSPCYWMRDEPFRRAVGVFEALGYQMVPGASTRLREHRFAGTPEQRAADIMAMFEDPSIDAIVCARGGYGGNRVLPLLDYEAIARHPKIFVGYSDVTGYLTSIGQRAGLVTFHGPLVTTLAKATEKTIIAMKTALVSDAPLELIPECGTVIKPGVCSGTLIGGNLTTLCHLVGTSFEPNFKGKILLIEDVGEMPYRIDRMLTQMKLAGCFNKIAGLILGTFKECGQLNEIVDIFNDIFEDLYIPILEGFEVV